MAGQVTLPAVGPVSKKALLIGGGAAALVMGVIWWRKRNAAAAPAAADTTGTDTSGLDQYGDYGFTGGAGTVGPVQAGAPITSNPQWTATVMQDLGGVVDPTQLAEAIGLYLTGSAVSPDQEKIIDQAISVAGYPPVSGANGYPPAIRTQPSGGQTNPPPGPQLIETSVDKGWPVGQWISDIATKGPQPRQGPGQSGGPVPGFNRSVFYQLNPNAPANINTQDRFIASTTYRIQ